MLFSGALRGCPGQESSGPNGQIGLQRPQEIPKWHTSGLICLEEVDFFLKKVKWGKKEQEEREVQ